MYRSSSNNEWGDQQVTLPSNELFENQKIIDMLLQNTKDQEMFGYIYKVMASKNLFNVEVALAQKFQR